MSSAVAQLQHCCQKAQQELPSYQIESVGSSIRPRYICTATLWDGRVYQGEGTKKSKAKQAAADAALNDAFQASAAGPPAKAAAPPVAKKVDYVNRFNLVCKQLGRDPPEFEFERSGAHHKALFTCSIALWDGEKISASAEKKQKAKGMACEAAVLHLERKCGGEHRTNSMDLPPLDLYESDRPLLLESSMFETETPLDRCSLVTDSRSYQVQVYRQAVNENIIAYLETGCGKLFIAVDRVPQVKHHVDVMSARGFKAHGLHGTAAKMSHKQFKKSVGQHDVLVLTAQVCLNLLDGGFFRLRDCQLVMFDACHHATKYHPYSTILSKHYHHLPLESRPRLFGMTASPIKAKASQDIFSMRKQLSQLEATMDCRIFRMRASERAELEFYAPKPKEAIVMFKKQDFENCQQAQHFRHMVEALNNQAHQDAESFPCGPQANGDAPCLKGEAGQAFFNVLWRADDILSDAAEPLLFKDFLERLVQDETIPYKQFRRKTEEDFVRKELSALAKIRSNGGLEYISKISASPKGTAIPKMCKTQLNMVIKTLDTVGHMLSELGFWSACTMFQRLSKALVKKMWLSLSTKERVKFSLFNEHGDWQNLFPVPKITSEGVLSPKVLALINILRDNSHVQGLKALVFVERRQTAKALQELLNAWPDLPHVKAASIVGHAESGMDVKGQHSVMDRLRAGLVNVVISTNLAAEGESTAFGLVVRMNRMPTTAAYIQSRSQARLPGSVFAVMMEEDDQEQIALLREVQAGEQMLEQALNVSDELTTEPTVPLPCRMYRIESTGACACPTSAHGQLSAYCASLPSDSFYTPQPDFMVSKLTSETGAEQFKCILTMPLNAPFREISLVAESAKRAKQLAALEAICKLHEMKELDDHLRPADDVSNQIADTRPPTRTFTPARPKCLSVMPSSGAPVHVYQMKFAAQTKRSSPLKLSLGKSGYLLHIWGDKLPTLGPLCLKTFTVEFVCVRTISFSAEELSALQSYHCALVAHLQMLPLSDSSKFDDGSSTKYLIGPPMSNGPYSAEWLSMEAQRLERGLPCPSQGSPEHLPDGRTLLASPRLSDRVVYSKIPPYKRFVSVGLAKGVTGNSRQGTSEHTYATAAESEHGLKVKHPEDQLIEVTHDTVRLLFKTSYDRKILLLPELCWVSPLDGEALTLPCALATLEIALKIHESTRAVAEFCAVPPPPPNASIFSSAKMPPLTLALITKAASATKNLELLEFLGDAFLKVALTLQLLSAFPGKHEGYLSRARAAMASNDYLCDRILEANLHQQLCLASPCYKLWTPPGYSQAEVEVGYKTLADEYEAILGVLVSTKGETVALDFMTKTGVNVKKVEPLKEMRIHRWDSLLEFDPVYKQQRIESLSKKLKEFEKSLGYTFKKPELLIEAFTHSSYVDAATPCYQRLEFLGDAALDFVVTQHLFDSYPDTSPGMLSSLKHIAVSNLSLARVARKHGFHKYILHHSPTLSQSLDRFSDIPDEDICNSNLPKAISDIFEAVAGAIFLEAGHKGLWKVYGKFMKPYMKQHATPDTFKQSPKGRLFEMCAIAGCVLQIQRSEDSERVSLVVDGKTMLESPCPSRTCLDDDVFASLAERDDFMDYLRNSLRQRERSPSDRYWSQSEIDQRLKKLEALVNCQSSSRPSKP